MLRHPFVRVPQAHQGVAAAHDHVLPMRGHVERVAGAGMRRHRIEEFKLWIREDLDVACASREEEFLARMRKHNLVRLDGLRDWW